MEEGPLRLVREFVNTRDIEGGTEALGDPDELAKWLRHNDLLGAGDPVTEADLDRAVELREAVRDLLAGAPDERAADVLSTAARRSRVRPRFSAAGTVTLTPTAPGVDGSLGTLLTLIAEAMTDGRWRRLKVCHNHGCRWAFFDTSRAGAGKWCTMAICGNRNKAAAWRARQRSPRR
ncbi:MAG TPA: CGNR zinc finger domain-containing protein [Actinophytocola sp.]|uniref:CGNR zinc finger domain-containing protein n=1 Tax=Actinophytocola sp. TaxID=1872138 RepID=UPI002DBE7EA5|nr:CGNR zinc finger domain-containing protein [Actinophytocola sp.]HEU5475003.1 CGNR zinc finger domain-containing protein [Actinophytocola sp.]